MKANLEFALDDQVLEAVRSGEGPDTAVAISPDESLLAVASYGGWLRVFDLRGGRLVWKRRIPEGLIRCVAFSPDGKTLYAGELSPDGFLYAFSSDADLVQWKYRTADDLGTAALPAQRNRFSIYGLPGVYHVAAPGSELVVFSAFHSTFARDGRPAQRGHLYGMSPDGTLKWKYPAQGPLGQNIAHFDVSRATNLLVAGISGESGGSGAAVIGIDLATGRESWREALSPFQPYFNLLFFWRSVAISPDGSVIAASANDGRVFVFSRGRADEAPSSQTLTLVQPIQVGDLYLSALAGWCRAEHDLILVQSQQTVAPQGTSVQSDSPPLPHPQSNRLFALARDAAGRWSPRWTWAGEGTLNGLWLDEGSRQALVVMSGRDGGPEDTGWRGGAAVVLSLRDEKGAIRDRPVEVGRFGVAGEMYFNSVMSASGRRVAVVETPHWIKASNTIVGRYRVVVLEVRGK